MPRLILTVLWMVVCAGVLSAQATPKVVFLIGDEEYRSEESMPMLAKMLQRNFGIEVAAGFSVGPDGMIDPNAVASLPGTEELADADLMVLFLRFRNPDPAAFKRILAYLEAGKPVVAFRTSTHAFRFGHDSPYAAWGVQPDPTRMHSFGGGDAVRDLLGQKWITHHGHFADGQVPLTRVTVDSFNEEHPILTGVEAFDAYSWLYHVEGGGDRIAGEPVLLLNGASLRSNKMDRGQLNRYPLSNPVAWTKTHEMGPTPGRVFMTTLGHPYDFRDPSMRRLAIQGILWALGEEDRIPEGGVPTEMVGPYEPNNSGFGDKYKAGLTPADLMATAHRGPR